MLNYKSTVEFGIIGIGRFGFALAKTLLEAGKEVIVLDSDEQRIKEIRHLTDNAFVVNDLSKETLEDTGIHTCETVFVCIGEKLDVSILTTLNVINMGVPRVISKAMTYEQGSVLEKLGAEVVFPESDMGVRIANRLINAKALEFIELNNDTIIEKIKLSNSFEGKTIVNAQIRRSYKLNIIAIERGSDTIIDFTGDFILHATDSLVLIGKKNSIKEFENYLSK